MLCFLLPRVLVSCGVPGSLVVTIGKGVMEPGVDADLFSFVYFEGKDVVLLV